MRIARLRIGRLRNLADLDLTPSGGINLLLGPNASGKSSVLEAIHILSRGKSFRTHQLANVLNYDAADMVVSAEVEGGEGGATTLGLEFARGRGRCRMRAGGRPVEKASILATILPVITIHQESHRVFTEGPIYRRQFLDWGLFHVEHGFHAIWQRYRRALRQRNALLQQGGAGAEAWDRELESGAREMDRMRRTYLQAVLPVFQEMTALVGGEGTIEAAYRPGWDEDSDYGTVLRRSLGGDRALGYTRFGPHRADILFTRDGSAVREDLSRGQLKSLVCALYLAQAEGLTRQTGRRAVVSIDDLTAELDEDHSRRLVEQVRLLGLQAFVTSSEERIRSYLQDMEHKVFHVEHGRVREMV